MKLDEELILQILGLRSGATDSSAQNYINRVESAGGSFDLSSVNAQYTASYTKAAWNAYVKALKGTWDDTILGAEPSGYSGSNVWTKKSFILPLIGRTGVPLQKLLDDGTGDALNYGFVTGDLTIAGSGGGMQGNASSKYLDLRLTPQLSPTNSHLAMYSTTEQLDGFYYPFGSRAGNDADNHAFREAVQFHYSEDENQTLQLAANNAAAVGYLIGVSRFDGIEGYKNGSSVGTGAASSRVVQALSYYAFAVNDNGSPALYVDSTIAFLSAGSALSDAEALDDSLATNRLMTLLGANTYANPV